MKKIISIALFLLIFTTLSFAQNNTNIIESTNTSESTITNTNAPDTNAGFLEDFYTGSDSTNTPETDIESPAMTLLRIFLITGILAFLTWILLKFFFKRNALSLSTAGQSIEVLATVPDRKSVV